MHLEMKAMMLNCIVALLHVFEKVGTVCCELVRGVKDVIPYTDAAIITVAVC
jgi:hypothetical protein